MIRIDTEKERIMMEASIKRLELEVKSWHSKFLDKVCVTTDVIAFKNKSLKRRMV